MTPPDFFAKQYPHEAWQAIVGISIKFSGWNLFMNEIAVQTGSMGTVFDTSFY